MLRLRARPRKIKKNRRSKKLLRKPAIIPLIIVTLEIINKYLHKSLRKNHKNSKLVVQKKVEAYYVSPIKRQNQTVQQFDSPLEKTSRNHITRILREAVKTAKMLDGLDNNLLFSETIVFSLNSILYSQSFILITVALSKQDLDNPVPPLHKNQPFVFISQLKPYHFFRGLALRRSNREHLFFNQKVIGLVKITFIFSELPILPILAPFSRGKKETEEYGGDDVPFAFKKYYDGPSSDNQQLETEDGTPKQDSATQEQEDDLHYRHIRELPSPYSLEQQQAFESELWGGFHQTIVSYYDPEEIGTETLNLFLPLSLIRMIFGPTGANEQKVTVSH
ncbi:MAG: hypothetical protein AB2992_07220 (plasmid) [Candidatus Symbiodolus clandestinus]